MLKKGVAAVGMFAELAKIELGIEFFGTCEVKTPDAKFFRSSPFLDRF